MITQVLQISTTPAKYEMEIERARLEMQQDFIPKAKVATRPARLDTKTENAKVQMDSYQMRRSLGFNNTADWAKMFAEKGKESIRRTTREYVDMGNDMSRIHEGVTIGQIIEQKMLEQPVLYTAFLPSTGTEISWIPHQIEADYKEGSMQYDWQIMRNVMNYVPGKIRMTMIQRPAVEIEYTGSPMYIPPSASPDYVAPEE
ncbi:MAG: DUF6470 family protein [Clostridiales bacterium]